ncbi:MAG: T9SS type A sorting domain-containing protein [Opitutaceae bacterium]|nr:T9SS type A sorting domain-containing protein [Cytophagales bacterium]
MLFPIQTLNVLKLSMKKFIQLFSILGISLSLEVNGQAVINLGKQNQVIDGFGASSAWCGAINDNVMNALYGDLGYSILRLRIEEGIGDNWKTGNFNSWAPELSNAKKASAKGAIVFASPWNPPKSMQENFTKTGDASAQRLRTDKYTEYVNYLNAYVKYMKDNSVNLHSISVQNEPDYATDWNWWTPTEMLNFMKNYAGAINTKVIAPESFQYLKNMSDPILNDATAFANMDILGFHLYGTPVNQFAYPLFQQKRGSDKKAWMTEHYFDTDGITDIMGMSKELHDCMVTGNMNGYVYWWITWPNGLANSNGTIFKRAYVLGQFAKFIRPGYFRVDATATPAANVYVSAYSGNNKAVIVAINTSNSAVSQKFNIQNGPISNVIPYTTDNTKNLVTGAVIPVSANSFTAQLPAQSITTFVGTTIVTALEPEIDIEIPGVQIFPNPFSSTFELIANEPCSYSIHDASGKSIKEGKAFGKATLGNELLPGVYVIKTNTVEGSKLSKIVKQ